MLTPWGESQTVHRVLAGVVYVTTASHGGYLVDRQCRVAEELSAAAREVGEHPDWPAALVFEEDCDWAVLEHDHPGVCHAANPAISGTDFPEARIVALECCQRWNPEYLAAEARES